MKKVSIVTQKNQDQNNYSTLKIVIFDDNKDPQIINYEGIESLLPIVEFAKENGVDILGEAGLKPALQMGLVEVLSADNKMSMDKLEEEIKTEHEKYLQSEQEKMENSISDAFKQLKNKELETSDEEKVSEDTSMFTPVERNRLDLSVEDREFAEYLRLNVLRSKNQLPPVGLQRIEELKASNEKVNALEKARDNVTAAFEKYNSVEDKNSFEAVAYKNELENRKKEYEKLHATYRAELAEAIKNAKTIKPGQNNELNEVNETQEQEKNEPSRLPLSEEDRELAEYLRLDILRNRKQLPPVGLERIKELVQSNERIEALERARSIVNTAVAKYETIEDKNSNDAKLARYELRERQKEYMNLHALYRGQLAEAIRKANANINEVVPDENKSDKKPVKKIPAPFNTKEKVTSPSLNEEKDSNKLDKYFPQSYKKVVGDVDNELTGEEENKMKIVGPDSPVYAKGIKPVFNEEEKLRLKFPKDNTKKPVIPTPTPTPTPEPEPTPDPSFDDEDKDDDLDGENLDSDRSKENPVNPTPTPGPEPTPDPSPDDEDNENDVDRDDDLDEDEVAVKKTGKLKAFLKRFGAAVLGLVAGLGIGSLIPRNNKKDTTYVPPIVTDTPAPLPTETPEPIVTEKPEETLKPIVTDQTISNQRLVQLIQNYCNQYNVPQQTRIFLQTGPVMNFLSQYKSEAQINEVLSAICYGYEANILTTKEGNFKLDQDGNNLLTSFTHDFLCAKAVVNCYSGRQMLAVFGGYDMSYDELMSGFNNYCYTVTTYGMNAREPLPFRYLTNNNSKSTKVLNDLQQKLLTVNINRQNGTLTSEHTDDFIAEVFNVYVLNTGSLNLSEGAKTLGAALVDSFAAMQSQIMNGEPLYLHEDYGYAKAGINLAEVDGHFALENPDKTTYEFTSLFDVLNSTNKTNDLEHCITARQQIISNLQTMSTMRNSSADSARLELASILYQRGYDVWGARVSSGNITDTLLNEISDFDPMLTDEVEAYRYAASNDREEYIGFEVTTQGVDSLLGIQNRNEVNFADLINNRRGALALSNNFTVKGGKTYTNRPTNNNYNNNYNNNNNSNNNVHDNVTPPPTVVEEKHEQVSKEDLTPEEQKEAEKQIEDLKAKEAEEHAAQQQQIEDLKEDLREGVENGESQEELAEKAAEAGVVLDENYKENMEKALEEVKKGEEERARQDAEIEAANAAAKAEAERRAQEEAERQAKELAMLEELMRQSEELEAEEALQNEIDTQADTDTPVENQTDSNTQGTQEDNNVPVEDSNGSNTQNGQEDNNIPVENPNESNTQNGQEEDNIPVEDPNDSDTQNEQDEDDIPVIDETETEIPEFDIPEVDQTDSERVDENAGEEEFVGDLSDIDIVAEDLIAEEEGPKLR